MPAYIETSRLKFVCKEEITSGIPVFLWWIRAVKKLKALHKTLIHKVWGAMYPGGGVRVELYASILQRLAERFVIFATAQLLRHSLAEYKL